MDDQVEEIAVELDWSRLNCDDFLWLADVRAGKSTNVQDQLSFLDHVIAGGIRGKRYPLEMVPKLFNAVEAAMTTQGGNPQDARGKV